MLSYSRPQRSVIARTVDLLGDRWTLLVLREVLLGCQRFDELRQNLTIASNVLALRLRRLVDEGLLERVQYLDRPARSQYVPTKKGKDVLPILSAMERWGNKWLS